MGVSIDWLLEGVTRNPFHPIYKQIFATNFDSLKFYDGDEQLPTDLIVGAFPHKKAVVMMERDEDGNIKLSNNPEIPKMVRLDVDDLRMEGTPRKCSCGDSTFRVSEWWSKELLSE